jgi:uncharacterized damage-inducible protein DinB
MSSLTAAAARFNGEVAKTLVRNFRAMPPEKQVWSPLEQGRSAYDMLMECAAVNLWISHSLTEGSLRNPDFSVMGSLKAEHDTPEKAIAFYEETAKTLVAAIEGFPEEKFDTPAQLPWAQEPSPLGETMFIPHWNTTYHIGQMCYIQTLYGDQASH